MSKKVLRGIMLVMVWMLVGCAGYTSNYRFAPYSEYYHYPYRFHDYPYGYHGYGRHGGHHW